MRKGSERPEDFFSLDNLDELCGIEENLRFAEQLIAKYFRDDWSRFKKQVDQIRRRQKEKTLMLSVIGEFSTGKSTFINAMLGKDLLVSSALQGTTVASTAIGYDQKYRIELQYLDQAEKKQLVYRDLDKLKAALSSFTTDPDVARKLRFINVYLPAEALNRQLCIIDTPGTNVTEAWHEDVTVHTLQELSDLSIILISAEKPVPESMLAFVRNNLEPILPQCVFVVTKLDAIRPRERQQVMDYIKRKLETELELEEAVVLPYVSPLVLTEKTLPEKSSVSAADDILLTQSLETEKRLFAHMAKQRVAAQAKKTILLIDALYQSISDRMTGLSDEFQCRLELLERTRTADLEAFVRDEKRKRCSHFDEKIRELRSRIEDTLCAMAADSRETIISGLDEKNTVDLLQNYISGALGNDCKSKTEEIISEAEGCYDRIRKQFTNEMNAFKSSFKKLYQTLRILPINLSQSQYRLPGSIQVETADLSAAAGYIAQELSKDNKAFFGGAAAGAGLGTMVLPGLGTILGGIIGAAVAPRPNPDQVRKNCKEKLRPQLISYFDSVCDRLLEAVECYADQIRTCLSAEIDRYLRTYRSEVARQIRENNEQKAAVTAEITELKQDMSSIQTRKNQLSSVIGQLNLAGRKG